MFSCSHWLKFWNAQNFLRYTQLAYVRFRQQWADPDCPTSSSVTPLFPPKKGWIKRQKQPFHTSDRSALMDSCQRVCDIVKVTFPHVTDHSVFAPRSSVAASRVSCFFSYCIFSRWLHSAECLKSWLVENDGKNLITFLGEDINLLINEHKVKSR